MSEPSQNILEQLNARTKQYQDGGMDTFDAVDQAASDFKLSVISDGDMCRIYQTPDGVMVNCWIDEIQSSQAEARPRFDNNIAWYTHK